MKIKLYYVLAGLLFLLMSACEDKDSTPTTIDRTVLVYIMGDNTLNSFVSADINEMLKGAANVDLKQNNLLVYVDDGKSAKLVRINTNGSGTAVQDVVKTYESTRNSVGLTEMKEVFSTVYNKYPAENYGLVLWSHGEGWRPGTTFSRWIGQDVSGDATLSISTLSEALDVFPYYEYILFDACFMQSVEVAYELRKHTGYFIGSPAEIPGPGAPYEVVVPALFAQNNIATTIAGSYYEYYSTRYNGDVNNANSNWTAGVAMSVIETSKLEALAAATKTLLPQLVTDNEKINITEILNYDRRSTSGSSYVGYYDFDCLMKKLTSESEAYTTWAIAYEAAIPYAKSTAKIYTMYTGDFFSVNGYSGVSTYIPRIGSTSLNASYQNFEWYTAAGWDRTGW